MCFGILEELSNLYLKKYFHNSAMKVLISLTGDFSESKSFLILNLEDGKNDQLILQS